MHVLFAWSLFRVSEHKVLPRTYTRLDLMLTDFFSARWNTTIFWPLSVLSSDDFRFNDLISPSEVFDESALNGNSKYFRDLI